ncbi:unnamed protein product [Symbiodinium pilosum]|uniref:Uncharacterized protein n=1 Tax=Symbiodinium pilosum TaxID=2952 RepID=A0A812QNS6_SYMPI|nr:unnamed protein product [Symbiodinium pilosum]
MLRHVTAFADVLRDHHAVFVHSMQGRLARQHGFACKCHCSWTASSGWHRCSQSLGRFGSTSTALRAVQVL